MIGKFIEICNTIKKTEDQKERKEGYNMAETATFLGLPAETWVIVGGLYFIATFLPTVIALVLGRREGKKTNE